MPPPPAPPALGARSGPPWTGKFLAEKRIKEWGVAFHSKLAYGLGPHDASVSAPPMAQGDPASRRDELSGRVDLAARPPSPPYPKGRVRKKRERARREEERREETREGGRTLLGQKTIPQPPAPFGPGPGWRTLLAQGVKSARSSKSRLNPLSHPTQVQTCQPHMGWVSKPTTQRFIKITSQVDMR